jgi:ankyrin repeat protein
LEKGADINAQDERGMTALMWAAHMGDPEMTRLLISKGAKLNIRNNDGFTALSGTEGATDELHLKVIRILMKAGAK